MTLRDEILSRPDCAAALAERDCGALAAILSVGRVKTVDKPIGYGTVLEALGADAGAAFLDGLTALAATSSPVKWALKLLDRGELNIGASATQSQLDALATAGAIPQAVVTALKGLAIVPDAVSPQQVADAMFNPDWSDK
jgi:lysozyme family protein